MAESRTAWSKARSILRPLRVEHLDAGIDGRAELRGLRLDRPDAALLRVEAEVIHIPRACDACGDDGGRDARRGLRGRVIRLGLGGGGEVGDADFESAARAELRGVERDLDFATGTGGDFHGALGGEVVADECDLALSIRGDGERRDGGDK